MERFRYRQRHRFTRAAFSPKVASNAANASFRAANTVASTYSRTKSRCCSGRATSKRPAWCAKRPCPAYSKMPPAFYTFNCRRNATMRKRNTNQTRTMSRRRPIACRTSKRRTWATRTQRERNRRTPHSTKTLASSNRSRTKSPIRHRSTIRTLPFVMTMQTNKRRQAIQSNPNR